MSAENVTPKARRFLALRQVRDRVQLSKSTLYRHVDAGTFPRPVRLGSMARWVESEIDEWMTAQIARRDEQA
jgi:prophage regulatory protein